MRKTPDVIAQGSATNGGTANEYEHRPSSNSLYKMYWEGPRQSVPISYNGQGLIHAYLTDKHNCSCIAEYFFNVWITRIYGK